MQTGRSRRLGRVLALGVAAIVISLLPGCETTTSEKDITYIDPVKGIDLVGEHKTLMGMGETVRGVWVDPRTEAEYGKGHIPGAVNIPYQHVTRDNYLLKDYDIIVVYGSDYNDAKASGMSKKLMELGFKKVHTLEGGLRAWRQAGYEVETGENTSTADATE